MKLLNILNYKRPAGSDSEKKMIAEFIDTLPNCRADKFGNRIVQVGDNVTTMFSCHTDTVHYTDGLQNAMYDPTLGQVFVQGDECLGADDGAGIIIMINMIKANINGLYIFHREEELGGRGSSYIASETPELLNGIQRCIAFDRRGTDSVITHQAGERCCSDEFAEELCNELMQGDLVWFHDSTGSFTDTANYTHLIPECTNLSCGYDNEHSNNETLNVRFLEVLIKALLKVQWDKLPTERNHNVIELDTYPVRNYDIVPSLGSLFTRDEFLDFVYDYPEEAADLLMDYAYDIRDYRYPEEKYYDY